MSSSGGSRGNGKTHLSKTRPGKMKTQSLPSRAPSGLSAAACACDAEPRKAVAVDPEIKEANRKRLRRIEGQIRGLQKMVEEDRYCADIITQVASVQEALRGVARSLMRNHLHHCAAKALRSGNKE